MKDTSYHNCEHASYTSFCWLALVLRMTLRPKVWAWHQVKQQTHLPLPYSIAFIKTQSAVTLQVIRNKISQLLYIRKKRLVFFSFFQLRIHPASAHHLHIKPKFNILQEIIVFFMLLFICAEYFWKYLSLIIRLAKCSTKFKNWNLRYD